MKMVIKTDDEISKYLVLVIDENNVLINIKTMNDDEREEPLEK